jgi:hypothetical protein
MPLHGTADIETPLFSVNPQTVTLVSRKSLETRAVLQERLTLHGVTT